MGGRFFLTFKIYIMKKMLLMCVLSIFAISCSRSETTDIEIIDPVYGTENGGVSVSAFYEKKLGTGEITEQKLKADIIHIWDATNRDFDVEKSTDIITGYLYDRTTQQSVKPVYSTMYTDSFYKTLKAGKYFIYINTGNQTDYSIPKFNHSYSYFDVKLKQDIKMKKVFKLQTGSFYQPW